MLDQDQALKKKKRPESTHAKTDEEKIVKGKKPQARRRFQEDSARAHLLTKEQKKKKKGYSDRQLAEEFGDIYGQSDLSHDESEESSSSNTEEDEDVELKPNFDSTSISIQEEEEFDSLVQQQQQRHPHQARRRKRRKFRDSGLPSYLYEHVQPYEHQNQIIEALDEREAEESSSYHGIEISPMKRNDIMDALQKVADSEMLRREDVHAKTDYDMESSDLNFSDPDSRADEHEYQIGELGNFAADLSSLEDLQEIKQDDESVNFSDGNFSPDLSDEMDPIELPEPTSIQGNDEQQIEESGGEFFDSDDELLESDGDLSDSYDDSYSYYSEDSSLAN